MRVVSGKAKGKALKSVPGDTTRPILDRVKVALFDILRPMIAEARVLDLFSGTGGVGIEALSQGASHCVFLDLDKKAVETIEHNLKHTGLDSQGEVRQADAFGYLRRTAKSFDLIYIAPPQYVGLWIEALRTLAERPALLNPEGLAVVQIDPKEYEEMDLETLELTDERKYGSTVLLFYRLRSPT